jgi:hypothetical protein
MILISLISYFFGFTDPKFTLSLLLLLSGVWTLIAGIVIVEKRDRTFYSSWGVVVAVLSSFAFLPTNYTIGLVLVAIVALILVTAFGHRSERVYTAATSPPSHAGETPAAT